MWLRRLGVDDPLTQEHLIQRVETIEATVQAYQTERIRAASDRSSKTS